MREYYYSFNQYLRRHFGERVHRISLDAGFACPNLDGTLSRQGCFYCNNQAFSVHTRIASPLQEQITKSISFYRQRFKTAKFIAYFQAFSNTYASIDRLRQTYDHIRAFPEIVGLFISTRPDCIDEDTMALIASYKQEYLVWLEYGLQTTHNALLAKLGRNHTYEDFFKSVELANKYRIPVGVHVILGIPGAAPDDSLIDAQRLAQLPIAGVKLHVLHVLKDTMYERSYKQGELTLLEEGEYVHLACDFLERLPEECVILRLVSTAYEECLVAPSWINDKRRVTKLIEEEFVRRGTRQGSLVG